MKFAVRTLIASADYLNIERLLGQDPLFSILGSAGDGAAAVEGVFSLRPDFLILEGALPGLDGLALLSQMRLMPAPPRVLCLCPEGEWAALALEKGADRACLPLDGDALFARLSRETALSFLPRLAAPWENARLDIAERLLSSLAMNPAYKGRAYLRTAVAALACSPALAYSYQGMLYPYLSQVHSSSPQAVERAIRAAIEDTWLHGSLEAIQRLFGLSVDAERGKPTNAEFLSMLTEHARRETARKIKESLR